MANRLAATGTSVAWLNLDEEDRELDAFVTYLTEAFRRCLASAFADAAPAMASHAGLPARAALAATVAEQ